MQSKEHKAFLDGCEHGKNTVLTDLLNESDKRTLILALFRKAHQLADNATDPLEKARLEAYSEGFRHSLNILDNLGSAKGAYDLIINPSIKVPITDDEIRMLGSD
jgi:regulator of RNase E activity RraB